MPMDEKYTFFYRAASPFSQHYPCEFLVDGVKYNCAEQYMMHQKAVLFNDSKMAKEILETENPQTQKKLGRKVENFEQQIWKDECQKIVKKANLAKFSQNPDLLDAIKATKGTVLVEAAPRDCLWGIGLGEKNSKALRKATWRGKNLLGYILTEVRDEICESNST